MHKMLKSLFEIKPLKTSFSQLIFGSLANRVGKLCNRFQMAQHTNWSRSFRSNLHLA